MKSPTDNPSEAIRSLLVRQITNSVQRIESTCYLVDEGVVQFTEMGPSVFLTRLAQQIQEG